MSLGKEESISSNSLSQKEPSRGVEEQVQSYEIWKILERKRAAEDLELIIVLLAQSLERCFNALSNFPTSR